MEPILRASALELAARIRNRASTSREIVEAHIARVRRVNPTINALVHDRFEQARAEADAADEKVRSGAELPPLHGVPCSIKECFRLEGMPNTSGLLRRKGLIADGDATAVERLRRAGAIPLGVTNVSELCMWMESNNLVYGRTRNPYDPSRIVGGSSGGEGAIVGAGGTPFGLGSDIGGSIRMPAFFNGVFGHKPSGGLVPVTGQYPAQTSDVRMLSTGPLARRAEDLMPLLRIMAGPDGQDTMCTTYELGDPASVDLSTLTVTSIEGNGVLRVADDLLLAQRRAAGALKRRGAKVRVAAFDDLKRSLDIWAAILQGAPGPSYAELMGEGVAVSGELELLRFLTGRRRHTLPSIALALLERITKRMTGRTQEALAIGKRLRAQLLEAIGDHGVLLYPSYPRTAPKHNAPLLLPIQWMYTAIFNAMELPVTQVPLGLSRGVPLGVQVVAAPGNDHVSIAVAMELERAFGGWVPPPILA